MNSPTFSSSKGLDVYVPKYLETRPVTSTWGFAGSSPFYILYDHVGGEAKECLLGHLFE